MTGKEGLRSEGLERLRQRFEAKISSSADVLDRHSNRLTEFGVETQPPELVVFVTSEAEVIDAVVLCAEHGVPIIAYGAGTSLEGQANAP